MTTVPSNLTLYRNGTLTLTERPAADLVAAARNRIQPSDRPRFPCARTQTSLTIFTIPKPFTGHIGVIQRNAIQSWLHLTPRPQVILCGNEAGTAEIAAEFKLPHLRDLARNEYGTPFLHNAFDQVRHASTCELLCYINTDIILTEDFIAALSRVSMKQFLLVGRRLDLDLDEPVDFKSRDWQKRLDQRAQQCGTLHSPWGIDYFVFPRQGVIDRLPPFVVGRPGWDNWMIYQARRRGIPVIDATPSIRAIHQNHNYEHVPMRTGEKWVGPEARRQIQLLHDLMDGHTTRFAIVDATHILTAQGIGRTMSLRSLRRRWETLAALNPRLRPLVMTFNPLVRIADWLWTFRRRGEVETA